MEGAKIYLQPKATVLNAVSDLAELQKGTLTFSDNERGIIHFAIEMYAFRWELGFTVTDIGKNRSRVAIGAYGEKRARENLIRREFALLDSILLIGAEIEFTQGKNKK